jgi:hypothetical protein
VLFASGRSFSQDVIAWDSATKLTWADFAGTADRSSPYNAVTISGILFKINPNSDGYSDSIIAVFYRAESWVKGRSESALIHEQGHFDISEIFARKLRNEAESERDAMENLYDKDTKHSIDAVRQAYWNGRIGRELKALEEFAN